MMSLGGRFQALLAELSVEHEGELATLRMENWWLRQSLYGMPPNSAAPPPLSPLQPVAAVTAGASVAHWERLAQGIAIRAEAQEHLMRAARQQRTLGFEGGAQTLEDAQQCLSAYGGAGIACRAHDMVSACPADMRHFSAFFRSAASAIRSELILRCACEQRSTSFDAVRKSLERACGRRLEEPKLKSQLFHAYEQTFPGMRNRQKNHDRGRKQKGHRNNASPM